MADDRITGYKFNLNTSSDVKRMLSKIASELYQDKIDNSKAKTLTYIGNTAISAIKTCEVEARLDALEDSLNE